MIKKWTEVADSRLDRQKIPFLNSAISEKAQNLKKTRLYAAAEKDFLVNLNAPGALYYCKIIWWYTIEFGSETKFSKL